MPYTHLTSICIRGRFNAGFELFSHGHSHLATHHHVGESVGGGRGGVGCPPAKSLPPQSTQSSNGILPYVQS